jgi:NAD(P)H-flavin reductase
MKLRGPYGNGWPIVKLLGQELVLIAGGIGLIPLRPLIFELIRNKSEFKNITLVVGAKTDQHILFHNDLLDWKDKIFSLEAVVEKKSRVFWGKRGMITEPLMNMKINKKAVALICGPEIMVPYCIEALQKNEIADKNILISFERRMECGIGICQHCNIGKYLVCRDGPVFSWDKIKGELT